MSSKLSRNQSRIRRHARVRKKISGTPAGNTLVSASSVQMKLENGGNIEAAQKVGAEIAKRALEKNIKKVVFDRGGFVYTGRVKALAEAAREAGLEF